MSSTPPQPREAILAAVLDRLEADSGCRVRVGAEVEFYLRCCPSPRRRQTLFADLDRALSAAGIQAGDVREETGPDQYEVALCHLADPLRVAADLASLKEIVVQHSARHGCLADFSPRPDPAAPPSALHVHVSLLDKSGHNVYAKARGEEAETELMQCSIAGLCALMNEAMVFFAPREKSYARFRDRFTDGPYRYSNAPATVSWGGNNRTVAVRIPTSSDDPQQRHLENRVPGADADPSLAIAATLAGVSYGIENHLPLTLEKTWGDAGDEGTGGWPFVGSLHEAIACYHAGAEVKARLQDWPV
jgi:glutamine synthetase